MTPRFFAAPTLAVLALAVSACAGTPREGGLPTYGRELDALRAECAERGGILVPIPGATSGEARRDNACEIRGGASRLSD